MERGGDEGSNRTSVLGNREALVGDATSRILGNVNSLHCGMGHWL